MASMIWIEAAAERVSNCFQFIYLSILDAKTYVLDTTALSCCDSRNGGGACQGCCEAHIAEAADGISRRSVRLFPAASAIQSFFCNPRYYEANA